MGTIDGFDDGRNVGLREVGAIERGIALGFNELEGYIVGTLETVGGLVRLGRAIDDGELVG